MALELHDSGLSVFFNRLTGQFTNNPSGTQGLAQIAIAAFGGGDPATFGFMSQGAPGSFMGTAPGGNPMQGSQMPGTGTNAPYMLPGPDIYPQRNDNTLLYLGLGLGAILLLTRK